MRHGNKNGLSFVMDRYGNRIMAQAKCKGDHTRALHSAFKAAAMVPLSPCGIRFRAASNGNKRTKGMPGNPLGPIERVRDSAKTSGGESAKKMLVN